VRRRGGEGRDERGAVTAELALGLPVLLALTVVLVWMLSVGVAQVMVVDASREAARMVARGDSPDHAEAAAARIAPDGAAVTVRHDGDRVLVVTSAEVRAPGSVLGRLAAVTVTSEAVAVVEPE
jgi:Flp pilus assembly protein TadG